MPQEIHDGSVGAPGDTNATANLSAHVFSNPTDFLQILKSDFNDIGHSFPELSKGDLVDYSIHGADPKGRAAAKIAADHFGELQAIPDRATNSRLVIERGISEKDLDIDISVIQGNTKDIVKTARKPDEFAVVGALFIGTVGALLLDSPTSSLASTVVPVGLGAAGALYCARDWFSQTARVKAETTQDQQTLNSWL